MNRDNVLFTVIGLLAGFISGYFLHESMSERQPARRIATEGVSAAAPAPGGGAAAGGATSAPGATGGMQEVQRLRQYVEENPQDADAVQMLANLNYDIQNWSRAAELYGRFLELRPDDPDTMTDLGASLRNMGQIDQALAQFRRVRELAPDHWQARYNEILVLAFDRNDPAAARGALAELKSIQPQNPDVERLEAEIEKRFAGA